MASSCNSAMASSSNKRSAEENMQDKPNKLPRVAEEVKTLPVQWTRPAFGVVAVDVDAHYVEMRDGGRWGYGVVFRDRNGEYIRGHYGRCDPYYDDNVQPHLRAIQRGVEIARSICGGLPSKYELRSVSKEALDLVTCSASVDISQKHAYLVQKIRSFIQSLDFLLEFRFVQVSKEANRCANWLACSGANSFDHTTEKQLQLQYNCLPPIYPPGDLRNMLREDAEGSRSPKV